MTWFTPARHVLLTGAGFTKNYGGYLANEMWAAIFRQPEIREDAELQSAMHDELNFEVLYDEVLRSTSEYSIESKHRLVAAVRRAYLQMHKRISYQSGQPRSAASAICSHAIARFVGKGRERGFFFTLNQDLFIEEFFPSDYPVPRVPGLPTWPSQSRPLDPERDKVRLPDEAEVARVKATFGDKGTSNFVYLKLHGSLGWTGHDGDDVLVIGQTKSELIEREPLLRWYLELFKEVLHRPEVYLVTIGYGFGDLHINHIIVQAIREHKLRLCVVSPEDTMSFRMKMLAMVNTSGGAIPYGSELWPAVSSYWHNVSELCEPGSSRAPRSTQEFFESIDLQ